jgi:hypothetical protein
MCGYSDDRRDFFKLLGAGIMVFSVASDALAIQESGGTREPARTNRQRTSSTAKTFPEPERYEFRESQIHHFHPEPFIVPAFPSI